MSVKLKYFTVEEANALLPSLTEIFNAARETRIQIEKKIEEWRKEQKTMKPTEEAVIRGQVDFLANMLEGQMEHIAKMGCLPKDLDAGLVDFPARVGTKEGYLCWKVGEPNVQFWHGITDGFKGRKPLEQKD